MIDHLELQTRDVAANQRFYEHVLPPLGYRLGVDGNAKGFEGAKGLEFFIAEGEPSRDVHFAFRAPDRHVVDAIYAIASEQRLTLDRPPALAPHIHPHYYAAYLRDPDGRLVEFVCHEAE